MAETVEIQFLLHFLNRNFIQQILEFKFPNCFVNLDPIGHLAKTGNWHPSIKTDYQNMRIALVEKFLRKIF